MSAALERYEAERRSALIMAAVMSALMVLITSALGVCTFGIGLLPTAVFAAGGAIAFIFLFLSCFPHHPCECAECKARRNESSDGGCAPVCPVFSCGGGDGGSDGGGDGGGD